jgi:hypothetical protein
MKLVTYFIPLCLAFNTSNACAECYGDAADQYGCGNAFVTQGRSEGSLERFGGGDGPIIIDNGTYGHSRSPYDVFTPEEERRMYRNAVLNAGNRTISGGYANRSFRANSRAQRLFRGRRVGGFRSR